MKSSLFALVFATFVLVPVSSRAGSPRPADEYLAWRFNFTPALVSAGEGYGLGVGVDPEVRYGYALAEQVYLSVGGRVGVYHAKGMFGAMVMPTARITVPFGALDTYAAAGAGYGWVPKQEHSDFARMVRVGLYYHFSEKIGVGTEVTHQAVVGTGFHFYSLGSMISFGL